MDNDRKTGLALLALCAVIWLFLIPRYVLGHEQQIFPRILVAFIALPSLLMAVRKRPKKHVETADPTMAASRRAAFIRVAAMAAAYFAYLLLVPVVGFFVSSFAVTVGAFLYFGIRDMKTLALVPVCMLGSIYIVIQKLLNVQLPSGVLF